eukprot:1356661-Rhodomonas_salina.3
MSSTDMHYAATMTSTDMHYAATRSPVLTYIMLLPGANDYITKPFDTGELISRTPAARLGFVSLMLRGRGMRECGGSMAAAV